MPSKDDVLKALVDEALERSPHPDRASVLSAWREDNLTDEEREARKTDEEREQEAREAEERRQEDKSEPEPEPDPETKAPGPTRKAGK